jgi:hypothetical protein
MADDSVLGNSLKLLGEVFVPGASEMLEGRLASGLAHNVVAGVATLALAGVAPVIAGVAVFVVKADSFSRSVNDRSLFSVLGSAFQNGDGSDKTTATSKGRASASA